MHPRVNLTVYFTISDSPGDVSCVAHRSVTKKRGIVHPRFGFCDWAVLAQTGACAVQWLWGGPPLLACPWAWLFVADPFWAAGQ